MQVFTVRPLPNIRLDDSLLIEGDSRQVLASLPADSVQCIVTSPPYWGLRDYGIAGQIGLELSLAEYIQTLNGIFSSAARVLSNDGVMWLNIGDGYTSGNRGWRAPDKKNPNRAMSVRPANPPGLKDKDLLGIPWRLAFALQDSGWYLRSDIIWNKPNAMPESVKDRPTRSHEYLFMFTKSESYRYDGAAIREVSSSGLKRNRRTVWNIHTENSGSSHIAAFPPALVEPCILSSTRRGDFVLDPFMGSGTVGLVAQMLGRRFVGIELNPEYIAEAAHALRGGSALNGKYPRNRACMDYETEPALLDAPSRYGRRTRDRPKDMPAAGTDRNDPRPGNRAAQRRIVADRAKG